MEKRTKLRAIRVHAIVFAVLAVNFIFSYFEKKGFQASWAYAYMYKLLLHQGFAASCFVVGAAIYRQRHFIPAAVVLAIVATATWAERDLKFWAQFPTLVAILLLSNTSAALVYAYAANTVRRLIQNV